MTNFLTLRKTDFFPDFVENVEKQLFVSFTSQSRHVLRKIVYLSTCKICVKDPVSAIKGKERVNTYLKICLKNDRDRDSKPAPVSYITAAPSHMCITHATNHSADTKSARHGQFQKEGENQPLK